MKPKTANFGAFLKGLCESDVDFILVGGMAAVIQGAPITTFDIDIVHKQSKDNIQKLTQFLKTIDACYRRLDEQILVPDEKSLSTKGHSLLNTNLGPLDVLAHIEHEQGFAELLPLTVEIEYQGYKIKVLSLDALIKLKEETHDPAYQHRLAVLKKTKENLNS